MEKAAGATNASPFGLVIAKSRGPGVAPLRPKLAVRAEEVRNATLVPRMSGGPAAVSLTCAPFMKPLPTRLTFTAPVLSPLFGVIWVT